MINNYSDFLESLQTAGFSMGGGTADGIYSVITWNWGEEPPHDSPIRWHTGDPETDPWEWRIRVLTDGSNIAYAKLFFKKSGYITQQWYPFFLAARRKGQTFQDMYEAGVASHFAKRIYDVVSACNDIPLEAIKQEAGFTREDKSGFDRALTELQMGLFITMCDSRQRLTQKGTKANTWPSTVFTTTEKFFDADVFEQASKIPYEDAIAKIRAQILELNPAADEKRMLKFILGR